MRISSKSNYALKALLHLALNGGGGVVPLGEVARVERIPIKFLEQVVLALKAKGLVESKRGASGGYRLASDPSTISLRDVLDATEDTVLSPAREKTPEDVGDDAFSDVWTKLNDELDEKLSGIRLSEIVLKAKEQSEHRSRDFSI